MLNFISFGSGSSGNCYLLYNEYSNLLIDCGIGIRNLKKKFKDHNIRFEEIQNILITHDHADHIKAVGTISTKFNVKVYATKEVHEGIDKNFSVRCKIPNENRIYIEHKKNFIIGDFKIYPFKVPHDSSGNIGYKIEYKNIIFSLITDIGHVTQGIIDAIKSSNYLVIEANYDMEMLRNGAYPKYLKQRIASDIGHLSNLECAKTISEHITSKLHHVWLCHLSEENNHPELVKKTMEKYVNGKVVFNVLKRKVTSGPYKLI